MNIPKTSLKLLSVILSLSLVVMLLFPTVVLAVHTEGEGNTGNIGNVENTSGEENAVDTKALTTASNTLQDLVDSAVDGGTIHLTAGTTYTGDATIDQALTIEGDGTQTIEGTIRYSAP